MPRYVNADKLHYKTVLIANGFYTKPDTVVFAKEIDKSAITDVRENIHSEWISKETLFDLNVFVCSNCKMRFATRDKRNWNYCPNCGAKMGGGMAKYGEKLHLEEDEQIH